MSTRTRCRADAEVGTWKVGRTMEGDESSMRQATGTDWRSHWRSPLRHCIGLCGLLRFFYKSVGSYVGPLSHKLGCLLAGWVAVAHLCWVTGVNIFFLMGSRLVKKCTYKGRPSYRPGWRAATRRPPPLKKKIILSLLALSYWTEFNCITGRFSRTVQAN